MMKFRERFKECKDLVPPLPSSSASSGEPSESDLRNLRNNAEKLLALGDEAINRALSGNSAAFLAASRQSGGE
jgi:hypothetical protein